MNVLQMIDRLNELHSEHGNLPIVLVMQDSDGTIVPGPIEFLDTLQTPCDTHGSHLSVAIIDRDVEENRFRGMKKKLRSACKLHLVSSDLS